MLIGGDIHGGAIASDNFVKQSVATAQTTNIAKGAQISADASKGAGGNIVIWSDGHTSFAGQISAKGQTAGGFSEVSSHDLLGFTGRVDLTSMHGTTGTLLLDPENVTIEDADSDDGAARSVAEPSRPMPTIPFSMLPIWKPHWRPPASKSPPAQPARRAATSPCSIPLSGRAATYSRSMPITPSSSTRRSPSSAPATLTLKTDDGGTGGSFMMSDGAFVDYGPTNNGGKLTINGTSYKLLYTMAQVQAINATNSDLSKNYALATPLNASSVSNWTPLGTDGAGNVKKLQ